MTDKLPFESLPIVPTGPSFELLSGVVILDLTTSVAGPYATMLLGDFGAEVIKVERPEGDDARKWGPPFLDEQALWFTALNRNKKSVVLDARTEQGLSNLEELVRRADVVITNQPPDVQRKLRLDYESLRALRENLVHVSISGFGLDGERAELTCYDLIAEGYSGIMDLTGESDSPPQKVGAPAADMLAGQDAAMATMAALYDRQKTGKGRKIDVSLVESMTRFLTCRISSYLGSGEIPRRSGGRDSVIAIYQSFDTADRPINLGLGSDLIWDRFWQCVGDPNFGARAEFSSNAARRDHRPVIVARIEELLKVKRCDEWLRMFAAARVPAGPIYGVDEVTGDAALQARGLFYTVTDGSGRSVPQVGLGIRIDDGWCHTRSLPPRLGEHSDEILGKLSPVRDC